MDRASGFYFMSSFSHSDFLNMVARLEKNKLRTPSGESDCEREVGKGGLHEKIMQWCNAQWPRWKFIHNRTDKRSGIAEGAPDFVIFVPGGRSLSIECKMPGNKRTEAQLAWATEMRMLGHEIYLVTSFAEFEQLVSSVIERQRI